MTYHLLRQSTAAALSLNLNIIKCYFQLFWYTVHLFSLHGGLFSTMDDLQ